MHLIGARLGNDVEHQAAAREFGRRIACHEIALGVRERIEIEGDARTVAVVIGDIHPVHHVRALGAGAVHGDP